MNDPNQIFANSTAPEIQERRPDFAILPIGAFEQHGAYLPMEADTLIACSIAKRISQRYNCFMLSPITVSCSHEHSGFFPSIWISPSTLHAIVKDIGEALSFHGLHRLCIVNAHGGNYILEHFAQIENMNKNKVLLLPRPGLLEKAISASGIEHSQKMDMHAGEYETSVLLADYPDCVRKSVAHNHEVPDRSLFHLHGMSHYSATGVIGYPEQASAEKGERIMSELVSLFDPAIREFLSLPLEKVIKNIYSRPDECR